MRFLLLWLVSVTSVCCSSVSWWLTNPDGSILFGEQASTPFTKLNPGLPTIQVNDTQTYQTMEGFGFTLTGGTAVLLHRMNDQSRSAILHELFSTEGNSIGVSYLRVSIGASDLDERVFSYDDLPSGETDPTLQNFSLAPDEEHLIPVLMEILALQPSLKILGSTWSPPAWMKTNGSTKGGSLRPEFFKTYALYLVKYIQGMKARGINIDAITVQNEPLNPDNNPSMYLSADQEGMFIAKYLGPMFKENGIATKIFLYDHNADRPDYPISILNDPEARKYVDGSAFHLYAGPVEALSTVHDAHPDKNVYFTEQWVGAPPDWRNDITWHVKTLVIGASRNWSRTVLEWNLAADPHQKPHTPGGCDRCLGAITIDGNNVSRNPGYYNIAVVSKFVRPGSYRVDSTSTEDLPSVAFLTPRKEKVVVVLNNSGNPKNFTLSYNGEFASCHLPSWSVGTYVW